MGRGCAQFASDRLFLTVMLLLLCSAVRCSGARLPDLWFQRGATGWRVAHTRGRSARGQWRGRCHLIVFGIFTGLRRAVWARQTSPCKHHTGMLLFLSKLIAYTFVWWQLILLFSTTSSTQSTINSLYITNCHGDASLPDSACSQALRHGAFQLSAPPHPGPLTRQTISPFSYA